MPRKKTLTPKMYPHAASGQYCVNINGHRHYLGKHLGEAEDQYQRLVSKLMAERVQERIEARREKEKPGRKKKTGATVAQVVARYLEERTPHLSVRQSAHYLNVGGILVSLFGELPIASFGAEEMREFRASLLSRTNQHKEGGCTRLVREALANGPRPSIQVEAQALAAGYCREVYRSARVRLGVLSKKVGRGWISWLPPGKCIPPPLTGLSQTYIKALLGIVRTMFRRLASEGVVSTEQAAEVAAVRNPEQGQARQTEGRLPPHPDHVEKVQQVLTPDYACAVLKLHRVTGARPGELCALTRDEVSTGADDPVTLYVKGHQLRVTAPPGCWLFAPAAHKARRHRKPRVILMGPTAQEILRPWLATGFGLTVTAYRQAVLRACRRAKVPQWTPHQVRHAYATTKAQTANFDDLQAQLGHSEAATTARYVADLIARAARVAE